MIEIENPKHTIENWVVNPIESVHAALKI